MDLSRTGPASPRDGDASQPVKSLKRNCYSMGCITSNLGRLSTPRQTLPPRKIVRIVSEREIRPSPGVLAPDKTVRLLLASHNLKYRTASYDSLTQFFVGNKQTNVDSYDHDVLHAVRTNDIAKLREYNASGRPLNCSNRFGESLLHLACRKGLVDVVDLLVNDIKIPLNIVDDMGRSPLHDAFWTSTPNFKIVEFILNKCPDLLYIKDRRGHTPLNYARKEHWEKWSAFLKERSNDLIPVDILTYLED